MTKTVQRTLLVCFLALMPAAAQDYWNRVSGSFGGLVPAGGWQTKSFGTAPVLAIDYGFRFHRHGQFDAGVDVAFANQTVYSRNSSSEERRNIYIPRVGYRVVVPVWHDRIETHVGFGGAHTFFKPALYGYETWLVYGQLGANYALDTDRKYRAGTFVRWYRDPIGSPVQQWVSVGAEISYSFGK